MVTLPTFTFPFVFGISIGLLLSYSVVLKQSAVRVMEVIVWPTDSIGDENEETSSLLHGVPANLSHVSFADSQLHGGRVNKPHPNRLKLELCYYVIGPIPELQCLQLNMQYMYTINMTETDM